MVLNNVGEFRDIDEYVQHKTKQYRNDEKSLKTLFKYMFSESTNTFAELSDGYRIKKITYGECRDNILKISSTLADKLSFAAENSLVGIYMSNSVEWIEIFWSILRCGFRPLLMNSRLSDEILETILSDYQVAAVITDEKQFSVPSFSANSIITKTLDTVNQSLSDESWADEIVFMSSGTSDNVKLCFYTGENLFYQVCGSADIISSCPQIKEHYNGELKQLALLPFYHVFGFIAVYIWFGFYSRTFVFLKDLRPQTLTNTIKKHKVTHIFAVPLVWDTIYKTAMRTIRARGSKTYKKFVRGLKLANGSNPLGRKLAYRGMSEVRENLFGDSIRFMISGGSHISSDVLAFFNGIGYHLANGYGMTEIGITSVEMSSDKKILNSGSIGTPFANIEYKLEDNGDLLVRTKTMASRIIQSNIESVTDYSLFFNTNDLAKIKNGHFYLEGRKDDLIICENGENLNPTIAEACLKIEGCESLCIFADKTGAPTLLLSAPNCFTSEQFEALHNSAVSALNNSKLDKEIKHIVVTTDRLLNGNDFKISRHKIAERYADGKYSIIDPRDTTAFEQKLSALEFEIRKLFSDVLKKAPEEIYAEGNFFSDFGGTSLDYFTLMDLIKERFNTELPISDGRTLSTVHELCDYLKNKNN